MTVHLNSDVPVPYGSWDEYPVMQPVGPKEETPLAAVFISNCGGTMTELRQACAAAGLPMVGLLARY